MSLSSNELMKRREANLIGTKNLMYQDNFIVTHGKMQYLYDQDNNQYLDMLGGFSVVAFGHGNEEITSEITSQINKVIHSTQVFLNEPIVELAERLHANLDAKLSKTFFLNSGSEANEMAISLAKKATGKSKVMYMEYSLHGRTRQTLEVTNMQMWHPEYGMNDESLMVTNYYPADHASFEKQMEISLASAKEILENNHDIACMIVEPIQGNAGVRHPHRDYFKRLYDLLSSKGVLLIMDEAQTGLGRTGYPYAHMYYDVVPDILMTCKSLGNGMPISSCTTTDLIASRYNVPSASTTGGNMASCASAIGVLKYYDKHKIIEQVQPLITVFDNVLENLNKDFDIIKSVRGVGLIRGIEVCTEHIDRIIEGLKDEGIIVGRSGLSREVILLEPPLVITKGDLEDFNQKIRKVIKGE